MTGRCVGDGADGQEDMYIMVRAGRKLYVMVRTGRKMWRGRQRCIQSSKEVSAVSAKKQPG